MDDNPEVVLITTTINVPHNLYEWRKVLKDEDLVVIAGDQKTPEREVRDLCTRLPGGPEQNVYLAPGDQESMYPELSRLIGWNTVQRRNIALLEAMSYDPKVIITVDDDNRPLQWITENVDWNDRDELVFNLTYDVQPILATRSSSGWYNVAAHLIPPAIHRGFPHSKRYDLSLERGYVQLDTRVGVVAMMWIGDPDVDALDRYKTNNRISTEWNEGHVVLDRGTWCPFNSQATALRAELAPLLFYWPGVGRYDDIWASFVAQRVMEYLNYVVRFGYPLVEQRRGEHTVRDHNALFRDLQNEMFGLMHTDDVIDWVRLWVPSESDTSVVDHAESIFEHLANLPWLSERTDPSVFTQWIADVRRVLRERERT